MPEISAFSLRPSPPLTSYMVLKIRSQTRRACECKPVHVFITVAKNMGPLTSKPSGFTPPSTVHASPVPRLALTRYSK